MWAATRPADRACDSRSPGDPCTHRVAPRLASLTTQQQPTQLFRQLLIRVRCFVVGAGKTPSQTLGMKLLPCALSAAVALGYTSAAEGGSLASLPFSWDTLPRYTFCVNSCDPKTLTDGLFNEEALDYISKQPIYLNNPSLVRPAGAMTMEEQRQPRQAQALLKKNPKQRQWLLLRD